MASFESRLFELFLCVTDRKKRDGLHRFVNRMVSPTPPRKMYEKYNINDAWRVNGQTVFTLSPKGSTGKTHILYLHGGAYIKNFCNQHWRFLGRLIDELHCTITAPDYPLAPQHTYKDAFAMVLPIYKKLVEKVGAANLTVMGDSAGGGMGLALAKKLRDEEQVKQPKNIILLSPWLDVTMMNPDIAEVEKKDPMLGVPGLIAAGKMYAGDANPNNYLISPINGSLKGLGPITLFVGTHDVFIADCRKLERQATEEGVKICCCERKSMMHVWMLFSFPESKVATKQIIEIINK